MRKKRIDVQDILTDDKVELIQKRMEQALGPAILQQTERYGLDVESSIRFMAVSSRMKARREAVDAMVQAMAKSESRNENLILLKALRSSRSILRG